MGAGRCPSLSLRLLAVLCGLLLVTCVVQWWGVEEVLSHRALLAETTSAHAGVAGPTAGGHDAALDQSPISFAEGDQDDEDGDDEEDDPWVMSPFDKLWLQFGWLLQVVFTFFMMWALNRYWPYRCVRQLGGAAPPAPVDYNGLDAKVYRLLWNETPFWSPLIDSLILALCVANLVMFTLQTEATCILVNRDDDEFETSLTFMDPKHIYQANLILQIVTLPIFFLLLLLRAYGARAHPTYRRFGAAAPGAWFACSVYAHFEIIALLPSLLCLITGEETWPNLLWLTLARTFGWMEKAQSAGIAMKQMRTMMDSEGNLIITMLVFGVVLWTCVSGLYFLANRHNEESEWEAAVLVNTEPPQKWQRFESIPSSMFFALVNLCKENPLADKHVEFWSRLIVMSVCMIGVPVFAMPAGVVGSVIRRLSEEAEKSMEEEVTKLPPPPPNQRDPADEQPPSWSRLTGAVALKLQKETHDRQPPQADKEKEAKPTTFLQRAETGWVLPSVTAGLSFGSAVIYMYSTAGHTQFAYIPIYISPRNNAVVDGQVAAFFLIEFVARLGFTGTGYLSKTPLLFMIDVAAWLPGLIYMSLVLAGQLAIDIEESEHTDLPRGLLMGRKILAAMCVLRVLKLERYFDAFKAMWDIIYEHRAVLKATGYITFMLWIGFSVVLYYTERSNHDDELKANYSSVLRALWAEAINLHGEWVWCDYTAVGKGVCTLIMLFSGGVFMVPIAVFSDGFQDKLQIQEDSEGRYDVQPWQASLQLASGLRSDVYDILYGHLHTSEVTRTRSSTARTTCSLTRKSLRAGPGQVATTRPVQLTYGYRIVRAISIFCTIAMPFTTGVLTLEMFKYDECVLHRECRDADLVLYLLDVFCAVWFTIELGLRLVAIHVHHLASFVGMCDILSLVSLYATLTPFRRRAFHPEFQREHLTFVSLVDDVQVPIRLLRLFCFESYLHPVHTLARITWINRLALARAGYCLITIWYIVGTLYYVIENDPVEAAQLDRDEQDAAATGKDFERGMPQRFADVLTGLQYALVHLTGDYPITEYKLIAQLVHLFSILVGMCAVAAFTGIFVAGFVNYLRSERMVERRQLAEKRVNTILFAVLALQRQYRRMKKRRAARHWMEQTGHAPPSGLALVSVEEAASRQSCYKRVILRSACRSIVRREGQAGERIMLLCNIALLINIVATLAGTVPEVDKVPWLTGVLVFIELITGTVFVLEYLLQLGAAVDPWKAVRDPMRLIDLFCLFPTFFRLGLLCFSATWRRKHDYVEQVVEVLLITRVARILDFPYIKRYGAQAFTAIRGALENLGAPIVLALTVWVFSTSLFSWLENFYEGPDAENLCSLPSALYWTSIYIIGEWANVDFSFGAGSRMCIFYCLFGVAVFAVPVGLMMEAVENTIVTIADERKQVRALLEKGRSGNMADNNNGGGSASSSSGLAGSAGQLTFKLKPLGQSIQAQAQSWSSGESAQLAFYAARPCVAH